MPLPISAEIDARWIHHCQSHNAVNLTTIGIATVIFAPRSFLCKSSQIRPGYMMMMTDLATPHPGKERLRVVGMDGGAKAIRLLVIDPVHRLAAV
jgi:hypothetical protein